ncbi:MAG TPA: hypothetical protein VFQ25_17310 [Ktedonobacterales bacterium]|nr:hypothetical protein [Ktedonobacterales bacterium]
MNREQTLERLRAWARRAQSEAQYADTREDRLKWQGQAQALSGVASLLAEQGGQKSDFDIWSQVVYDREKSLAAWQERQSGPDINMYAGQMAGYDVALTALKDVDGVVWPRRDPHVG